MSYLGGVFALLTAFFFSSHDVLIRMGMRKSNVLSAVFIVTIINFLFFWILAVLTVPLGLLMTEGVKYFMLAGLLALILGRGMNYAGMKKLGVNISTPIKNSQPVFAMLEGVIFLGESLPALGWVGVMAVTLSGIILSTATKTEDSQDFKRRHLVLPLSAAIFYGTSYLFVRLGIIHTNSAILGSALQATVSLPVLMAYLGLLANTPKSVSVAKIQNYLQWVVSFRARGLLPQYSRSVLGN